MVEMMLAYLRFQYSDDKLYVERVVVRSGHEIEVDYIDPKNSPNHRIFCVDPLGDKFMDWKKIYLRKKKLNKIKKHIISN
jgi:hypothetical protein